VNCDESESICSRFTAPSRTTPEYQVLGDFEVEVKVTEFLGTPGEFNVSNVTVEYRAKFGNILLGGLTARILAPATAVVSGTVVKYL
jgi:hypothetical protein